jgi:hypothetical protein
VASYSASFIRIA